MSNTYTWSINKLSCTQTLFEDYVAIADWTVTGTDGSHVAVFNSQTVFNPNFVKENSQPFIPYKELTENIVLQWIKDHLEDAGISDVQKTLDNQISNLANPPILPQSKDLPWQ